LVATDLQSREALREDVTTPRAYPCESRGDVVAVAGRYESGVLLTQIVEDFGITEASLRNWLRPTLLRRATVLVRD